MDETADLPCIQPPPPSDNQVIQNDDMNLLSLSLSLSSPSHLQAASTSLLPPPPRNVVARRPRRNPTDRPLTIPPPYPWAQDRRCLVLTMAQLHAKNIFFITGDVHCKKCDLTYQIQYNLQEKFDDIADYLYHNLMDMRHRAPRLWMNPVLMDCQNCNEQNTVKPVIAHQKKSINWLFLLLGQMLGVCTLDHLKYFCKHTGNHRTGAKDRLLFLTYLNLCRQIHPQGAFYV